MQSDISIWGFGLLCILLVEMRLSICGSAEKLFVGYQLKKKITTVIVKKLLIYFLPFVKAKRNETKTMN